MNWYKFRIFCVCTLVILVECLAFLGYREARKAHAPLTVQVLQKADKSNIFQPAMRDMKSILIDIFGIGEANKVIKVTKRATKEVAVGIEYSTMIAFVLLGVLFLALNMLIFKNRWLSYRVEKGDTIEQISSRFIMTERSLLYHNPQLRGISTDELPRGLCLKVRNRYFTEKDYLDQLRDALKFSSSHFPIQEYNDIFLNSYHFSQK